jgi:hypothetical protein
MNKPINQIFVAIFLTTIFLVFNTSAGNFNPYSNVQFWKGKTEFILFNNYTQSDTIPPQLVSFSFDPVSVNTSSSSQDVTFTFRITDNLSGFRNSHIHIDSQSGQQFVAFGLSSNSFLYS